MAKELEKALKRDKTARASSNDRVPPEAIKKKCNSTQMDAGYREPPTNISVNSGLGIYFESAAYSEAGN